MTGEISQRIRIAAKASVSPLLVDAVLDALSALGLVLTTREVVEAALALESENTHGNMLDQYDEFLRRRYRLAQALRAAPNLTGEG